MVYDADTISCFTQFPCCVNRAVKLLNEVVHKKVTKVVSVTFADVPSRHGMESTDVLSRILTDLIIKMQSPWSVCVLLLEYTFISCLQNCED